MADKKTTHATVVKERGKVLNGTVFLAWSMNHPWARLQRFRTENPTSLPSMEMLARGNAERGIRIQIEYCISEWLISATPSTSETRISETSDWFTGEIYPAAQRLIRSGFHARQGAGTSEPSARLNPKPTPGMNERQLSSIGPPRAFGARKTYYKTRHDPSLCPSSFRNP
jgi:hypothetical protein